MFASWVCGDTELLDSRLLSGGVLDHCARHSPDYRFFAQAWTPDSWQARPIRQAPVYPDQTKLKEIEDKLTQCAPIVSAGDVRRLKTFLAEAADGHAFVMQGGDCAEPLGDSAPAEACSTFRVLKRMAAILASGASLPVVEIGRMAGQFAKPRSSGTETVGDITLPSYRGDIINGREFSEEARVADPTRMITAHLQSVATLHLLQSQLGSEGFSRDTDIFTSHEALLLPYEQALTRRDRVTGDWYGCSAHFLWIGDRTRQADGAHIEFLRGVKNPLGLKVGPTQEPDDLLKILDVLNPSNEGGRITLISRMGADQVGERLPRLVRAVKDSGHKVVWLCDPMHGNTRSTTVGLKTRDFQMILREILDFFRVHDAERTWAGGMHFEMTGRHVTECIGGQHALSEANLGERYETTCDPRLNPDQANELAGLVAEELRQRRRARPQINLAQLVGVELNMSNSGRSEHPAPRGQRATIGPYQMDRERVWIET